MGEPGQLIVVDERDEVLGYESRAECHRGAGLLHRAFSIYVFDEHGRLLLQRRSQGKLLWPGYWSNSCCSHPTAGEDPLAAARRRLVEEMGFSTQLALAFKFRYRATFGTVGSENELCSVYLGRHESGNGVAPAPEEVEAWRFEAPERVDDLIRRTPDAFTPWFRIAWQRVATEFVPRLSELEYL